MVSSEDIPQVFKKSVEYAQQLGFDICYICLDLKIAKSVITKCGHKYCEECLLKHINEKSIYKCPVCKRECRDYTKLADVHRDNEIFKCPIPLCDEKNMTLINLGKHIITGCDYRTVECKCGEQMVAKSFKMHREEHSIVTYIDDDIAICKICDTKVLTEQLVNHIIKCNRRIVICTVCGITGPHFKLREHIYKCKLVQCDRCDDVFAIGYAKVHDIECVKQIVTCPANLCIHSCSLKEMVNHIQKSHLDAKRNIIVCSRN